MPKLSPALTFGPGAADWQERINFARMRSERADRMKSVMRKQGIASLLVTGANNTRYLAGLKGAEFAPGLWYVLFFADADPVVFAHAGYITQYAQECPWIRDWRLARSWLSGICGPEAAADEARIFAREVMAEIRVRGLAKEPLALIGFDGSAQAALKDEGLDLRGGWSLMLEATARKTQDEIACTKMAVAIAERSWSKVVEELKPGALEDEVSRLGTEVAYAAGADYAKVGFRSGPLTFERGMKDTGRILQAGELVYGNLCGTSYMGYRVCLYRTFLIGREPTQKEADWYKRLVERLDAVMDAIRPGGSTAEAARHFPAASTWGYTDEASVLSIEIGHGVGIHQYQYPVINRQWSLEHPQTFEPGMIIAVEGREGAPGEGGVRLEDMVLVTETGVEMLDRFPRDRILSTPFRW